jgi:hypothetical protein
MAMTKTIKSGRLVQATDFSNFKGAKCRKVRQALAFFKPFVLKTKVQNKRQFDRNVILQTRQVVCPVAVKSRQSETAENLIDLDTRFVVTILKCFVIKARMLFGFFEITVYQARNNDEFRAYFLACLIWNIAYLLEKNSLKYIVSNAFLPAIVMRWIRWSLFKLFGDVLYKCVSGTSP